MDPRNEARLPNQLLCGDITYIATNEGRLYLAALMDMFSRQIVGWSLQSYIQASLVTDALAMAWWRRRQEPRAKSQEPSSTATVTVNTAAMTSRLL